MWIPVPNMIVEVEKIGRARIIKVIGDKALVSLEILNGRQIELEIAKMSPVNSSTKESMTKTEFRDRKILHIGDKNFNSSIFKTRTIESLRFGLVPEHHIEALTLGFNELKVWAIDTFKRCHIDRPCGFEISGPYGTGKSHTLSLIRYLARKQGFLTARVEVDGQSVSLSNPAMLLNILWTTLTENDGIETEHPLVSLYMKAIKNGNIPTTIIPSGTDRIKNNLKTIYSLMKTGNIDKYSHAIEAVISCSDEITAAQATKEICSEYNIDRSQIRLEAMVGKTVSNRGKDFAESLAGHAVVAKLAGYKGLIVTIDEFEIEHIDKRNISRVEDTLCSLNKYLTGKTVNFKAPLGVYMATVDQHGYQGDPLIQRYIALDALSRYRLKVWEQDQRIILAENIHKMYCEAYKLNKGFEKNLAVAVEGLLAQKFENNDSGLIRAFIKWYIGMLDLKYGPPEGKAI